MADLRVTYVQPALPKYRAPVFRELAARPGVDFTLFYGQAKGITNVPPDGFRGESRPMRQYGSETNDLRWHHAQVACAGDPSIDVLCLSGGPRYLSLPLALRRARRRGLPTILWGHGYSKAETRLRRLVRNQYFGMATALLFYDEATRLRAIDDGFRPEQVYAAPNAIDQSPIEAARRAWLDEPQRLADFRRRHGLEGKRQLVYISRMAPANRLDLLVEAVASLAGRWPTLTVAIIGNGDAERRRLERLASERGVGDRLRFLGAIYDEQQLAPWCLTSDLFVYPANIGLSLLHAFGYGLPVITSDKREAQNPEIIALEDGRNGLLYQDGSPDALAAAIDRLLADDTLRGRLAAAAKQTVEQGYNVPAMVDGMMAAIEYCAHQRR